MAKKPTPKRTPRKTTKRTTKRTTKKTTIGRPTLFTPQRIVVILTAAQHGMKTKHIAQLAGINVSTLFAWLQKGKQGIKPFQEFHDNYQKATGKGILHNLQIIQKEAEKNWIASCWLLERCHGYTKNAPPPLELDDDVDANIEQLDVKELMKRLQEQNKSIEPITPVFDDE